MPANNNMSGSLSQFQAKMKYFYIYVSILIIWSLLALAYYIVNTVDVGNLACSSSTFLSYF